MGRAVVVPGCVADQSVPCRLVVKYMCVAYLQCFLWCREVGRTMLLHWKGQIIEWVVDWIEVCGRMYVCTYVYIVLHCGRVPVANAPGCTAAEGLLYKPWSLVVPTCTAKCLHQRP